MKTIIQELIEWIEENCIDGVTEPKEILFKAIELKEKEKQQIMDAYQYAEDVCYAESDFTAEEYYNKYFK